MSCQRLLLCVLLVAALLAPVAGAGTASPDAEIRAVYPNPIRYDDAGESVTIFFPRSTHVGEWTVVDGERSVPLPNTTVRGHVVLSGEAEIARNRSDYPVLEVEGLALANAGETLSVIRAGRRIDAVSYTDAPEGERLVRTAEGLAWRPLGATNRSVAAVDGRRVRAFVLPDAPEPIRETLRTATDRIFLAGYTFTDPSIARLLVTAARRGVTVRVLVEGGPVGGVTFREAAILDSLAGLGVDIRVMAEPSSPYRFHHAKYAVVDERAIVLTENWKPSGTGGRSSRGWGVVIYSGDAADELASLFEADTGWRDTVAWRTFRGNRTFSRAEMATGSFPRRFAPKTLPVEDVSVVVAPDNAERAIVRRIRTADRSVRIEQVSIGSRGHPYLRAAVRAARRGAEVRILLSSAWYVDRENRALVEWINRLATRENIPLEAKLASPRGRFEKIHAKGIIIDGDTVILGSVNWTNNSVRRNREVAVVLTGREIAAYYGAVFGADWHGGAWYLSTGIAATVLVGLLGAGYLASRRISFERETTGEMRQMRSKR